MFLFVHMLHHTLQEQHMLECTLQQCINATLLNPIRRQKEIKEH